MNPDSIFTNCDPDFRQGCFPSGTMSNPLIDHPSTGIAEIDDQHRELMTRFERLVHRIDQGKEWSASGETIKALANFAVKHFCDEEAYLRQFGYPNVTEHVRDHERLLTELQDLTAKPFTDDESCQDRLNQMRDWILGHICAEDMAFARYFASRRQGRIHQ